MAIPQTYEYDVERALRLSRQRAALSGTTLGAPETSRIISGTMAPHIQQYAQRLGRAQEREMAQQRWRQQRNIQKQRMQNEKEAAEMAGYAQWAQLGLYGANMYMQNRPQINQYMSDFDQWYQGWTNPTSPHPAPNAPSGRYGPQGTFIDDPYLDMYY